MIIPDPKGWSDVISNSAAAASTASNLPVIRLDSQESNARTSGSIITVDSKEMGQTDAAAIAVVEEHRLKVRSIRSLIADDTTDNAADNTRRNETTALEEQIALTVR